jgi:predicted permease
LGVFILTAGRSDIRKAFVEMLRVPAVIAILIAIIFKLLAVQIPSPLYRSIDLLSAATITMMLLILGTQIGKSGLPVFLGPLLIVVIIRLILSPALAWLISPLFQIPELAKTTSIVEAGMPSAVVNSILALKFDTEPEFVTGAVLITTLISPFTLTLILTLLQ